MLRPVWNPAIRRFITAAAVAAVAALAGDPRGHVEAQSACGPSINPIVCENMQPGDPPSLWDISGAGDPSLQGFATEFSVVPGQTQQFKIDSSASNYTIDIYRMGYYGGNGARKIATIAPSAALPQTQPPCLTSATTGLIDCGNWAVSASWTVSPGAVSGIYFAKLTRPDTGGASHIMFVVRDDTGRSDLLFQTSDTTWQAYNNYGGRSLYEGGPGTSPSRAYKVSYNRPFNTRATNPEDFVFNAEYPMVRFLEANGYNVSYSSGIDGDRRGAEILEHKLFLSVGHDEYWSGAQRANVEAARGAGVHLAFFSGNEIFWKTRWETSIDGSATPYRTLVTYKETHAGARIDPADPPTWTGTWRDPRFSPPSDGGRPENALSGTIFMVNDGDTTSITVPAADGKARFWRNTSIATLATGAVATLPNGTLGYEWDSELNNGSRPAGLFHLSTTTKNVVGKLLDYGSTFGPGTVTHNLTLYRHTSGALVFGAGTIQWSWGLDANHDRAGTAVDVRMKQATVNLFADMGVQPGTLQAGLVAATASTDLTAPTSVISSPTAGTSFVAGSPITVSGTASDAGGGIVAGVEVSLDGGTTWSSASGTTSWTFSGTVTGSGSAAIRSRAYDDSGNMETPTAGVTITITPAATCPCSVWNASTVPPAPLDDNDPSSVELGMRFRADTDGYITAVRFYKGSLNTGTHTGSVWTNTGTLLGSVTFSGETASGWQQANLASAIPVTANTTYVVSYHAPVGHYTGTNPFFATSGVDNAPLHALRDGLNGSNGVYAYSTTSIFPTQTFDSENYWVDVVFNTVPPPDTTPPTVTSRFPANGATGVNPATAVTVTFSEAMDPSTISSSTSSKEGTSVPGTFELRDPATTLVTATVTYDSITRTATLTPSASLALSTTYTATVKGGATDPRVKDLAGNALAANATWTFTTAAAPPPPVSCPCRIWSNAFIPSVVDDGDPSSVELGTRFRSDLAGYITGARFYKSTLNTGTHTARLWTNTGTLLGNTTFTGESASGWQEVAFPSPIAITANTTYVISYHAPNGHYAGPDNFFAAAGVDNAPLHALRDGADGPNGVYAYGATSVFPNQTFLSESYFVDVVFNTTIGPDVTPPVVSLISPLAGASGVRTNSAVSATFNEAMDVATINGSTFQLLNPSNAVVPAAVTYTAATNTATLTPSANLAYSTVYRAVVKGGSVDPRAKDVAGNALANDFTWSFTTAAPPPPPPTQGPGGPVLVITSAANPFSSYYAEILRAEGFNAFATADLSTVTGATLAAYDVAILGEMPLTAAQATMFTDWVNSGGNLIAMRPDKQLAGLLGLVDAASTLSNAYLLVNTASAPGAGIVNQTIQFHGTADLYTLNGATAIATLYANATTSTANAAVTMRTVGGGKAVAFTYDLARSIVYTRQGNPAWSGQERDGLAPIRSDDLYFGARTGDVQPDWVNLSKVAIPQADEQQRFLWNIVLNVNAAKKPLPRFWYFPRMLKAVVIMTGDDHANGGTAGRFDGYLASSAPGCSVADWQCIRGTSYIYPNTPLTDGQAANYVTLGFEIALHVNTNCADWTPATLPPFYSTQLGQFASAYPHVPAPATNRTHCIVWSDYATQPQVALNNGIRLDTTYYYWPDTWIQNRPGMFTGSGMPMRFTTATGQMIDIYQAATQMTDESGQSYPLHANTLLDNALGPLGYYGAFTANMHTDFNPSAGSAGSDAIVASAQARGVPVVTAKQMLDWLDGRNASTFQSIVWSGNVLSFNIAVGAGATSLRALVPAAVGGNPITGITLNGAPVTFTTDTIKGIQYAVFAANAGSYQASYGPDVAAPIISAVSVSAGVSTATVTWTTNELSDSSVSYGTTPSTLATSVSNSTPVTSHSIPLTALTPGTTYYYRVSSADTALNTASSPASPNPPATFTTSTPFIAGTIAPASSGSGTSVTLSGPVNATVTADAAGNYTFSGLVNGTYTVTPAKSGYTFTPASRSVIVNGASATGIDFSTQPVVVSGSISPGASGSGATVTLSGPSIATVTADSAGAFTFSAVANGTYTVTPSKSGYTFTPAAQSVTVSGASVTGITFTAQPTVISGSITPSSIGAGSTVTLSGAASATVTADAAGNYTFSGVANGSYTVTPTKTGFVFNPVNQAVSVAGSSVTGVNFTGTPVPTWNISGTITPVPDGASATVTLSGAATATTTTDSFGNYTFTGLLNGAYTVTPSKTGFTFTPANRSVTVSGANVAAVDFVAQPIPTWSISGTITPVADGAGTTVTLSGAASATTTANASGNYSFAGLQNGTYTVTPTKTGVTFNPANRSVTIAGASVAAVNFAAAQALTPPTIDATSTAGRSFRGTSIATGTFSTTAGNELLLAFVMAAVNDFGTNTIVTSVTGGGLTWQLVRRTNVARGTSEIWRAFAATTLTNVSVTAALSNDVAAAITVVSFKGIDTSGVNAAAAIGATGGASSTAGAPSASLVTTRNNSLVFGVGNDWDGAAARTLGPNQTLVSQFLGTNGDTFWVQRMTNPVATSGTTVTINDTAPANHQYNLTICEILAALQ